jgi:hypothetical protein
MSRSETEVVTRLLAAFPGSQLSFTTVDRLDPALIERHARTLWGSQQGWVYLAWGKGPHWAGGSYRHHSWRPRFFSWPSAAGLLAGTAAELAATGDVYAGVLLRRTAKTTGGDNLLPGRWCWADCDGEWTTERQVWLDRLSTPPNATDPNDRVTMVIDSGRGHHVYVRFDRKVEADRLGELNHRLAVALQADNAWDPTRLLRLVGTWNHKTVPPTLVRRIR